MTSPEAQAKPCTVKGCNRPRAHNCSWCAEHRREKKTAYRRAREKEGHFEQHDPEATIRELLAFPEPAKYLALVRQICEPRVDRRTIAHRQRTREYPPLEFEMEAPSDDC